MAQDRKYSNLPDLDTSPDVFESGAANDATSQRPQSPTSSVSTSSDVQHDAATSSDEETSQTQRPSRISKHGISTSDARSQFTSARVDARDIDFSDRITNGRKSYRVPVKRKSRRRRVVKGENSYVDEYEAGSGSEEETFEERVARLRREVEEVKAEGEQRSRQQQGATEDDPVSSLNELGRLLGALQAQVRESRSSRSQPAATDDAQDALALSGIPHTQPQTTAAPEEVQRVLASASALESRLTTLESALGIPLLSSIQPSAPPPPRPVLTSLEKLDSQLSSLSSTTIPNLDAMATQIQTLTASATRLRDAREAARAAQASPDATPAPVIRPTTNGHREAQAPSILPPTSTASLTDDAELSARVEQLHNVLPSLSALSPLIPSLLDRLKSLRVLHTDAATVSERFAEAERLQAKMGTEIERWRGALKGFGERIGQVQEVDEGNKAVIEKWVGGLEGRFRVAE